MQPVPFNNSFTDLQPGGQLKITVPLLGSGGYRVTADSSERVGSTVVISAADLVGYEVSSYSMRGRKTGRVRLRFETAQLLPGGWRLTTASVKSMRMSFVRGCLLEWRSGKSLEKVG